MAARVLKTTLLFLALTLPVIAQSNTPCISACPPVSSFCDGDETGDALAKCTCQSYVGATTLFNCIKQCPTSEQEIFAGRLPTLCRDSLLPGVAAASSSTESTVTSTGSSSSPTSTSGTATAATTTSSSTSSSSPSATPNVAVVLGLDALKVGVLAGGVAVMIL